MWLGNRQFGAFLFDLDGVVTDTASVHQRAWQRLFDDVLPGRFDATTYRAHVDGKARIDGVTAVLAANDVTLPRGEPDDEPGTTTAWALANRKDALFAEELVARPPHAFDGAITLLRTLRKAGIATALVSASKNAARVLDVAGVADLFDVRVDGVEAERLGLPGKPDPALFLTAARTLDVAPVDAVVIEDAIFGVQAGHAGEFGLVVGVDLGGAAAGLRAAGADIVVTDLDQLAVHTASRDCPMCAEPADEWQLDYVGSDAADEGTREALLTVGNGYLATRGAAPESHDDGVHYPGTYIAGIYNRLTSEIDGVPREDESMVNLPNWLPLTFRPEGGQWLRLDTPERRHEHRRLDLRTGVLHRDVVLADAEGRVTRLRQWTLVSMAEPHRAAQRTVLIPENWSGRLQVRTGLDGTVRNRNVAAYTRLADRHLTDVSTGSDSRAPLWLAARTTQSTTTVAFCARTEVFRGGAPADAQRQVGGEDDFIEEDLTMAVAAGEEITVDKTVAVFTSRDWGISEPRTAARDELARCGGFDALLGPHAEAWRRLWQRFRVELADGDPQRRAVMLHVFHLLQTLSPHTAELDAGVPARGLHGEGYRGHVFWDEIFVLPFVNFRMPELSRSLLRYRYRRLPLARERARALGLRGALFPWQSGSSGREETPRSFYNPLSGRWMADNSRLQYHVGLAIAYNVWRYWQTTADTGFLSEYGAEMLIEVARFWASVATYDAAADRYDIRGVMGPDEFHDGYPDSPGRGVDNSAYVNVMTAWVLRRARDAYDILGPQQAAELWQRLGLDDAELDHWERITRRLRVPFLPNGLLAQFDGFGELAELDWGDYRRRYGDIGRLDLILEAEHDTPNRYQVSKQTDVLMLLYLFSAEELIELLEGLGYRFDPATIPDTVDYYLSRTSHGSTLSRVAHSWVLARTNRRHSWRMFADALRADLDDIQGGTTREGIHLGAMAGTLDLLQRCYTGLDVRCDALWLHPALPDELTKLAFELRYRNQWVSVHVDHAETTVCSQPSGALPVHVVIDDVRYELPPGGCVSVPVSAPDAPASA
ncbi:MAG: beta-phosphoglucomutase family hydrolase [Actinophytocola sp.]|nr:beta-phosphoglucomutase family hydrolase [Actinophytocola sp.]